MNAATFTGAARAGVVALVLIIAATLGLVAGSVIRDDGPQLNAGYPAGWAGGAAVPVSRTAATSFSLDAVLALAAIRDTGAAAASADYPDYGLRHSNAAQESTKLSPSAPTIR